MPTAEELVDKDYYLRRYQDVAAAGIDPVRHYFEHGDYEGRRPNAAFHTDWYRKTYSIAPDRRALDHYLQTGEANGLKPNPLFDPAFTIAQAGLPSYASALEYYLRANSRVRVSKFFEPATYLAFNPDLNGIDLVEHFIDHGHRESRIFSSAYSLSRAPTYPPTGAGPEWVSLDGEDYLFKAKPSVSKVDAQIARAASLEPDIKKHYGNIDFIRTLHVKPDTDDRCALDRLLKGVDGPIDRIILLPWLVRGGADLVAANMYGWTRGTVDPSGKRTMVIITHERSVAADDWLPKDAIVRFLPEVLPGSPSPEYGAEVLAKCIAAIQPKSILNINSEVGWFLYQDFGKQLSRYTELYSCLFCFDFDERMEPVGYARDFLRSTISYMKAIYTDNEAFITQLCEIFTLGPRHRSKFRVVYQPVPPTATRNQARTAADISARLKERPMTVLWAGRFSRQKRVDLLIEIATKMPDFNFIVAGYAYDDMQNEMDALQMLPNVELWGGFRSFSDLPIAQCDAFLYTSGWDGLPNILLEASASGLPIVASNVGGISELLGSSRGLLVDNYSDQFVKALREIAQDPERISAMVSSTHSVLVERHTKAAAMAAFRQQPSFLD